MWSSVGGCLYASGPIASPQRFALLVGVDEYPHLAESEQLRGSRNDALLMAELLTGRFQFPSENVQVLVNEAATSAAIRQQLEALKQRVAAIPKETSAYVVFHFSGHGSQVRDQKTGDDIDERDGMDETIVPYDAQRQGSDADIRDDELNAFAHQVCARESTRLWMILDCCHSGTGVRGSSSTRFRVLDRRLPRADQEANNSDNVNLIEKQLPAGAVALYACRSVEKEPEYQDGDRSYGLLTRFLTRVVNETSDLSKLSYGLLAETIESRYRQDRRVVPPPRPRVEGQAHEIVCGAGPDLDRAPYWRVIPSPDDRGRAVIAAGSFHGLTTGSLLQLYITAEQIIAEEDQSVCWLRVDEVDLTSCTARVLQREGDEWLESTLPRKLTLGVAVERYRDHGDVGARVRVVVASDGQDSAPLSHDNPSVPPAVRQVFEHAQREDESTWLHWAAGNERFDLLLRVDEPFAALFPAIAMTYADQTDPAQRGRVPSSLRGGWGPYDLRRGTQASREIQEALRRITRARNLIRLVDLQRSPRETSMGVQLTLEQLGVQDGAIVSRQRWEHPRQADDPIMVADGQYYDWRVTCPSDANKPVFVTILQVDSNMGIQTMVPAQLGAESPRLQPGTSITAGGYACCRDDRGNAQLGPRWTIVLATHEPNHYSWLSQDSLPRMRGTGQSGWMKSDTQSSLDELLLGEMYFRPRGERRLFASRNRFDPTWSVEMQQWLAVSSLEQ